MSVSGFFQIILILNNYHLIVSHGFFASFHLNTENITAQIQQWTNYHIISLTTLQTCSLLQASHILFDYPA